MSQTICFIGAGNMASSLIGGLLANGHPPQSITACDIDADQLHRLAERFGVETSQDNLAAANDADVVVLAVKPQLMREVCTTLAALPARTSQLFVSIAAGVPMAAIDRWLGGDRAIVRSMPNTPALLQLGATGVAANTQTGPEQRDSAERIMQAVGIVVWVEQEADLDSVTAVSGSGPAYFFYFIELLEQAGVELGLPRETAAKLARQTALGAASMANDGDVVELRQQVTSKKGTTEQAILSFQADGLEQVVMRAAAAARDRAQELAEQLTAE